jgi:hypothetical protein
MFTFEIVIDERKVNGKWGDQKRQLISLPVLPRIGETVFHGNGYVKIDDISHGSETDPHKTHLRGELPSHEFSKLGPDWK